MIPVNPSGKNPEDDSRQRNPSSSVRTTTDWQQRDKSEDHPQETKHTQRKYQADDPETGRHPGRITEWAQGREQPKGYEPAAAQDATDQAGNSPQCPGFWIIHPCIPPLAALRDAERPCSAAG